MALQPLVGILPQWRFGLSCNHSDCAPPRWPIVMRLKSLNSIEADGNWWMVGRYLSRHFLIKELLTLGRGVEGITDVPGRPVTGVIQSGVARSIS